MKNKKGFTLIELLTVIAILAVILLIAAPTILGVLDKARKNTFKNQVLLYVEGLKSQTALAAMGAGYSDLQKADTNFYAPTSDSGTNGEADLVGVTTENLNKIMDNQVLENSPASYFYVQWSNNGYNYYIGEGVHTSAYKTSCTDEKGTANTCETFTIGGTSTKLINSKDFAVSHILRNDLGTN